ASERAARPDRRSSTGSVRGRRRGRGRAPDTRISLPPDRLARGGRCDGRRGAQGDRRMSMPATRLSDIAVTERGTFFGYGDLVVDMRDFHRMRDACGVPIIFDATHSVQRPGQGSGGASGGAREFIPPLTLAAIAAGANGLFLETHPRPDEAPSDGPNMLPLDQMPA